VLRVLQTSVALLFLYGTQHQAAEVFVVVGVMIILIGAFGLSRRITENIQLRWVRGELLADLQASETAMAEVQRIAQVGSWEWDIGSNLVSMSAEAYRIFGTTPDKFGPSFEAAMAHIHPDDQAGVNQTFAAARANGLVPGIDFRIVMDDGTIRYVHENPKAIFSADGRALRITGTVQDITEQRLSENHLKFINLVLKTQMDAAQDGIMVVDADMRITAFNQRMAEIWRLPIASLQDGDANALGPLFTAQMKDPQFFQNRVDYTVSHPNEIAEGEIELADGRCIRQYTRALLGPSHETLGRVWFFTDISESKRAASILAYRDHLLHTVTAAVAIAVSAMSLTEGVQAALSKIGESMGVDRVIVVQNLHGAVPPLALRFKWEANNIAVPFTLAGAGARAFDPTQMAAWLRPLQDGVPIFADAATAKGTVRDMMAHFQNQSSLLMPVLVSGETWGFLGIDTCDSARHWADSEIEVIRIVADVAGSLIVREHARMALETSEQRFRQLTTTATDGVITTDKSGNILEWNPGAERIFGYGAAEVLGKQVGRLLIPADRQREDDPVLAAGNCSGGSILEMEVVRKDGAVITIEVSVSGALLGIRWEIISISRDITKRKATEQKLQFANLLLKTEMEASPDGILVVDAKGQILLYNQRFAAMWRVPQASFEHETDDVLRAHVTALVRNPDEFSSRVKYILSHPEESSEDELETLDGRIIERHSVSLQITASDILGRVWFFRDVTIRRAADALALRHAYYDVLTGLANRAVFVDAIRQGIATAQRHGKSFAILYLDLDHFKDVNDTLGHPVGDALLRAVAARLLTHTRATDTVARFGGDEFAILASEISGPEDAGLLADKLIATISEPFIVEENTIHSEASIGIELFSPKAQDAETLLSHADVALYRAKVEGRGTYRFFTDAMDKQVRKRVDMSTQLHAALASNELFLLYQPQVDVMTGRIIGLEALVRWRHPTRGIVGPGEFIPIAETSGMIGQLGHFVLLNACRQAKAWLDLGFDFMRISVNVSALQFKSPLALEADVVAVLGETGLPPHLLELELTESVLMVASREHNNILVRLRKIGVKFAIDDFGTGYSSLDYLRRFPADHIKIAQSFILNIETELGDASIVRAIIGLAHELNIKVIAEGVENRTQLDLVQSWGCQQIQGFYFSPPLAAQEINVLLSSGGIIHPKG